MRPEHNLQTAACVYADQVLPPEADYAAVETKIGKDDMMAAVWRKQAGIRAGQPDAQLTWRGRITYIEYKSRTGSLSDAQHKRHAELRRAGSEVYIVRTIATLRAVFVGLGIPLRHHSLPAEMRDAMIAARNAKPSRSAKPRTAKPKHRAIAAWNATLAQRLGQK